MRLSGHVRKYQYDSEQLGCAPHTTCWSPENHAIQAAEKTEPLVGMRDAQAHPCCTIRASIARQSVITEAVITTSLSRLSAGKH